MKVILALLLHEAAALQLPKAAVAFGGAFGACANKLDPAAVVAGETVSTDMANTLRFDGGDEGFALDQRRLQSGSLACIPEGVMAVDRGFEIPAGGECYDACGEKFGECDKCGPGGKCCSSSPVGDGCTGSGGRLDKDDHPRCVYWSEWNKRLEKAPGFCQDRCEDWCDDSPASKFSPERRCSSDLSDGWPAGTKACAACDDCKTMHYHILNEGVECASDDESLGVFDTVRECAEACLQKEGCRYFIYGKGEKAGRCYYEKTAPVSPSDRLCENVEKDFWCVEFGWWCPAEQTGCLCPKGWESDSYDFYDTLCLAPKYLTDNKCVDCPPGYTCDGPRITPVGAKCDDYCYTVFNGITWVEKCTNTFNYACNACDECQPMWRSRNKKTKKSSVALIVAVCLAAAVLLLAVAFVLRKRSVSKLQHRSESMPSVVEDKAADA